MMFIFFAQSDAFPLGHIHPADRSLRGSLYETLFIVKHDNAIAFLRSLRGNVCVGCFCFPLKPSIHFESRY